MGKEKKFRFIIGDSNKWHSNLWRVKIKHDDVYIMCGSGKYHKISLHGSGVCHSAVPKEEMFRFNLTPEQRTAIRWKIQPEAGQSQIAFTILIAFDQLRKYSTGPLPDDCFHIPTPPVFSAVVVQFVKTRAEGKRLNWDLPPGVHLLISENLRSGDNISAIYYYSTAFNGLIEKSKKTLSFYAASLQPDPPLVLSSGFVTASDSARNFYHIELKL